MTAPRPPRDRQGRYPFLDVDLVQEFLWLSAPLKNRAFKHPLYEYMSGAQYPIHPRRKKLGFDAKANLRGEDRPRNADATRAARHANATRAVRHANATRAAFKSARLDERRTRR